MALGVALLSLAACSPKPYQPQDIRNPPNLAEKAYPPRGWTWAAIPGQQTARRYGVASPPRVPRAEVLILPERAPAEVWFPAINALVGRGYTVWLADPAPAPLRTGAARTMIQDVIRKGSSGRLLILGEGRGGVAALSAAAEARGVVLWSPVAGSGPMDTPSWQIKLMNNLKLGGLEPGGSYNGVKAGDAEALAWVKANPSLTPSKPTYSALYGYELERRIVTTPPRPGAPKSSVPVWMEGGDAAARLACQGLADCKTIAPGIDAAIAVFDELTKEVTLGAPPPPVGRKREPARAPTAA